MCAPLDKIVEPILELRDHSVISQEGIGMESESCGESFLRGCSSSGDWTLYIFKRYWFELKSAERSIISFFFRSISYPSVYVCVSVAANTLCRKIADENSKYIRHTLRGYYFNRINSLFDNLAGYHFASAPFTRLPFMPYALCHSSLSCHSIHIRDRSRA